MIYISQLVKLTRTYYRLICESGIDIGLLDISLRIQSLELLYPLSHTRRHCHTGD